MSRTKFAAWFKEQFPHFTGRHGDDIPTARREVAEARIALAKAEARLRDAEDAALANDAALKAWVARRLR